MVGINIIKLISRHTWRYELTQRPKPASLTAASIANVHVKKTLKYCRTFA